MENTINFNLDVMGSSDIESMHIVVDAWRKLTGVDKDIMEGGTGFNLNTGYVYIALENGITIASCFGQEPEFICTDFYDGEEFFLDTYEKAEKKMNELNEREIN